MGKGFKLWIWFYFEQNIMYCSRSTKRYGYYPERAKHLMYDKLVLCQL